MPTLEEIARQSESGDTRGAFRILMDRIRLEEDTKNDDQHAAILDALKKIADGHEKIQKTLEAILNRPHPKQQEFPDLQKVSMDVPEWYIPPSEPNLTWVAGLTNSIRYDGEQTRNILNDILDKLSEERVEEEREEVKPEPKTVNSAAVRSRRTTQWKRFDNYNLNNILNPNNDGQTFFLPDSLILNSERVSLNGGAPLLNSDYTLTGNKLFFNQNQTGSQIDVRGQVK